MRRIIGQLMAAVMALVVASCAHAPAEPKSPEPDRVASDSRVEREAPAERPTMGSSRVYERDELDSSGESELGDAMRRLGHHPR